MTATAGPSDAPDESTGTGPNDADEHPDPDVRPRPVLPRLRLPHGRPRVRLHPVNLQITAAIDAATEPYKTVLLTAGRTGARANEILGLTWGDVDLQDLDDATVSFTSQAARDGMTRIPTKTDGSARVLPSDRAFAAHLAGFRMSRALDGLDTGDQAFILSTKSGKATMTRSEGVQVRPDGRTGMEAHEATRDVTTPTPTA